jgi:hypothetical protein
VADGIQEVAATLGAATALSRRSVNGERDLRVTHLAGAEEGRLCDLHGMELALDVALPKGEEATQLWKLRRQIEMLPNKALNEMRVIRQVVKDFGRRQAIALQLTLQHSNTFSIDALRVFHETTNDPVQVSPPLQNYQEKSFRII